jgi:hypothetical protein
MMMSFTDMAKKFLQGIFAIVYFSVSLSTFCEFGDCKIRSVTASTGEHNDTENEPCYKNESKLVRHRTNQQFFKTFRPASRQFGEITATFFTLGTTFLSFFKREPYKQFSTHQPKIPLFILFSIFRI